MSSRFIDAGTPDRAREIARQLDPQPLCPFCRHWGMTFRLWSCDRRVCSSADVVVCEHFEPQRQLFD